MKKLLSILGIATLLLTSCADNKTINGKTYRPYGILNEETCKNDSIQYEISGEAIVSGIIFCVLIVPPIYTFGFNLWQPVGLKKDYQNGGIIKGVVE